MSLKPSHFQPEGYIEFLHGIAFVFSEDHVLSFVLNSVLVQHSLGETEIKTLNDIKYYLYFWKNIIPSRILQQYLNVIFPIEVDYQVEPSNSFVSGNVTDGESKFVRGIADSSWIYQHVSHSRDVKTRKSS